jgi:hypothetical protein
MMLYEVRRAAEAVAEALRSAVEYDAPAVEAVPEAPLLQAVAAPVVEEVPVVEPEPVVPYAVSTTDPAWVSSLPTGTPVPAESQSWSSPTV